MPCGARARPAADRFRAPGRKDIGATRKARTRRTPPLFEPRLLHQRNSFGGCAAKSLRFVAGCMAICQTRAALS